LGCANVNGHCACTQFGRIQGVLHAHFQGDIARNHADTPHLDIWVSQGNNQRNRVITRRIGIDPHLSFHRAIP
jgi:hypothetical protein